MFNIKLLLFLYSLHICHADWVAEWMEPIREKIKDNSQQKSADAEEAPHAAEYFKSSTPRMRTKFNLKSKLEETLNNAENLIAKLDAQILTVEKKESILKETIAGGRSGISTVTVNTLNQLPRTYLVRDGTWTVCQGAVQYPTPGDLLNADLNSYDMLAMPKCIGHEIVAKPDPCVFASIIKYETVPERRSGPYLENDYFCLKAGFNKSMEQFRSVPKKIVNDTCKEGEVRSLAEHTKLCGIRVLADYSYYPRVLATKSTFPIEYCTEKDGSCKLLMAWQLTNATVENFQFLKNEDDFKKFFTLSAGPFIAPAQAI